MYDDLRDELVRHVQVSETICGHEVEGLTRPTTDRQKLEAMARILRRVLEILVKLTSPPPGPADTL